MLFCERLIASGMIEAGKRVMCRVKNMENIEGRDGMPASMRGLCGAPLRVFEELTSTNAWLLERANACEHGETVRALCQTAGRGRGGRRWHCGGAGAGLAFSVALRRARCGLEPEYQGAVAALVLARYLESHGLSAELKWPNDVLLDQRKIAGILGESTSDAPEIVVVGVGCNINHAANDFAVAGLAGTAVSMSMVTERCYDANQVFHDILLAWQHALDEMKRRGLSALAAEWRRRDALAGRRITFESGGEFYRGLALGVDDCLALRVRDDQGVEHLLRSGEIAHIGALCRMPENNRAMKNG